MRVSRKIVAVVVTAVLFGWLVRGIALDDPAAPEVQPRVAAPPPAADVAPPTPLVRAGLPPESSGVRNLFGYVEPERHVERAVVEVVAPPNLQPLPELAAPEPAAPPRPHFTWRHIGRFGPSHDPIAVFSREGEIVNRRAGERIDEHFVLRSIGVESVEVEAGDGITERVPLAGAPV